MNWIYLALAVVCSSGLSLAMKLGGRKGFSSLQLVITSCGVGTLFLAPVMVFTSRPEAFLTPVVGWAIISGTFGTLGFFLYVKALKTGPYGYTVAVLPAASLVSVLVALLFWGERLRLSYGIGITFVFLGLILIFVLGNSSSTSEQTKKSSTWVFLVISMVILQGIPPLCQAAVAKYPREGFLPFIFFAQLTGTVLASLPALRRKIFVLAVLPYALGGGLCGILSIFLSLRSYERLPVTVVSPIVLAAPVMVALLLSHFLFHERITWLGYLGIVTGLAGVYLLSLK